MKTITDRCKANLLASPATAKISPMTPTDARDITGSMIANQSLPSPEEIAAMKELEPIGNQCHAETVAFIQKTMPIALSVFETQHVNTQEILAVFEQRQMSWGEYNRFRLENYKIGLQALHQLDIQMASVDAAQRQAAAAENANFIQALQGLSASLRASQPVVTNCSQSGPFTNCVTR